MTTRWRIAVVFDVDAETDEQAYEVGERLVTWTGEDDANAELVAIETTGRAPGLAIDGALGPRPVYRPPTSIVRPTLEEQSPSYREAMIDAGRGHLLP